MIFFAGKPGFKKYVKNRGFFLSVPFLRFPPFFLPGKIITAVQAFLFVLTFLFIPAPLFARDVEITVIDADLSLPLEGARIVSRDGGESVCDGEGRAVVSVPDDRSVVLRVSYPGYAPGRVSVLPGTNAYTAELSLAGTTEERELVVEAPRPGGSETVSGRSVAVSGSDLAMPAETGIIGDVMNAVKLLPGVGYVGGYMAMPSVRGGEPSDVTAVFDGFYVERPYHWGGAFSIFDPKMIESAQLSHGVFSTRYGHTVSGLLDIHAKRPSSETAELELAVSISATNLNLALPLGGKGGISLMGKVTYWDPFVETAKLFFEEVRYISTTPFIRSGTLGASYDFSTDLSLSINGFFGSDGVGAHYNDTTSTSIYDANFYYDNKTSFLMSGLTYSPNPRSLLKFTLGAGLLQTDMDGHVYSENKTAGSTRDYTVFLRNRTVNFQGRVDYDLDLGNGFLFAAGAEERYSRWNRVNAYRGTTSTAAPPPENRERTLDILNHGISSSAYSLFEYTSENRRFGMELGIRGDHFLLTGKGYTLPGIPALNPRVNFDFLLIEDSGPFDSITATAGTGLFSSVNSSLQNIGSAANIRKNAPTQNRSWTTVVGTRIDFLPGFTFTFESYIKYVFNRAYTINDSSDISGTTVYRTDYYFDGQALIWGFDTMLQKFDSRYWNGWISYSYINARYRDPKSMARSRNEGGWYYPGFHRFHTLNLIVNYKPVRAVNLMTRFSLASGTPLLKTASIDPDPITGSIPYTRTQVYDDYSRAGLVIPLDVKLSIFSFNKNGKTKRELYVSFENLLSLVYRAEGAKDFDENTGRETPGNSLASYDLPIPLVTFGIKWSF
jgi:hypothetical protein